MKISGAFDLERAAILLVRGDKSDDWTDWYKLNIPIADDRFAEHQDKITRRRPTASKSAPKKSRTEKGKRRK